MNFIFFSAGGIAAGSAAAATQAAIGNVAAGSACKIRANLEPVQQWHCLKILCLSFIFTKSQYCSLPPQLVLPLLLEPPPAQQQLESTKPLGRGTENTDETTKDYQTHKNCSLIALQPDMS